MLFRRKRLRQILMSPRFVPDENTISRNEASENVQEIRTFRRLLRWLSEFSWQEERYEEGKITQQRKGA